jgi:hypothetical protein
MAQGDKVGQSASTTTSNRSVTYLNKVLDLVSLPEVPRKLPRS